MSYGNLAEQLHNINALYADDTLTLDADDDAAPADVLLPTLLDDDEEADDDERDD